MTIIWGIYSIAALGLYGFLTFDIIAGAIAGTLAWGNVMCILAIITAVDYIMLGWLGNAAAEDDVTPGFEFADSIISVIIAIAVWIVTSPVNAIFCIVLHVMTWLRVIDN